MVTGNKPTAGAWTHEGPRFDLTETKASLQRWLRARSGKRGLLVVDLVQPTANGGTGDNLIVTVQDGTRIERVVARLDPTGLSHIHEVSIEQHFRVLQALEPTPVPSPRPLWLETDASVLGVPFMVMSFVDGRAPSDFPIYNEAGFLFEATPDYRRAIWEAALESLVDVHRLDIGAFAFLQRPDRGADGLAQHLAYLHEALADSPAGEPCEPIARALDWLDSTAPANRPAGLSWGDSRIGNILFGEDARVEALLDWDQASLAGPLVDLGWWLLFDRLHGEDYGVPRLAGLGGREETIERWQSSTGHSAMDVEWYEILAAVRLAVVRLRGIQARALRGLWVPDADNPRSWQRLMGRAEGMIAAYEAVRSGS
jgi:aminoglycoside phosphotransferase (APT) family kinase protein